MQRQYKLKGERSFNLVFKHGSSVGNKYFVILYLRSKTTTPKVGLSVGKKIGNSVMRNLVKRRLRACFDVLLPNMNSHYNYVVIPRSGAQELSYGQMLSSLTALTDKIRTH